MTQDTPLPSLADLRIEIDRLDLEMHSALMARGKIIDTLIEIKTRQGGGSAFRPSREASMMRMMAERHRGILPFDTVESIWRVIIATFTFVQAHYSVHADASGGDAAMRDSARFHFGFTVPYVLHHSAAHVIDTVARSNGDLGMFRIDGGATAGAWWTRLAAPDAPKIIARLPFVERPGHPAGLPVFVVAQPLAEAAARDVVIHAVSLERWREGIPAALGARGAEIIGNAADDIGLSLLVAAPGTCGAQALAEALAEAGALGARIREAGSHAARFGMRANA